MRTLRPAIVLTLLALDRATKLWAMRELRLQGPIPVLPFFELSYVENTGAAFGLGHGANGFFIANQVSAKAGDIPFYFSNFDDLTTVTYISGDVVRVTLPRDRMALMASDHLPLVADLRIGFKLE